VVQENKEDDSDVNALEAPESSESNQAASTVSTVSKVSIGKRVRGLITHINVYLLLFILIIVLSGGVVFVGIQRSKKEASQSTIGTQNLNQAALDKIKGTDAKVGDAKQTLNIESNAIFAGKVLLKNDLDVAGTIKVGGTLNLPGVTVTGTSTFDQIQGNKLAITGTGLIQGQLTVQKNLTVGGGASFGGPISAPSITVQTFNLIGDLQFNRHIDAGGSTPTVAAFGSGLGAGGTASVSGTDTAGTITLNIGGGPPPGNCFVTVNFAQKFNSTPHVVVSPSSSGGAGLDYYVTRTSSSFTLCSTAGVPSGTLTFDYVAID
jgi:cytoskeletal protein CcmA (bactofilin family)